MTFVTDEVARSAGRVQVLGYVCLGIGGLIALWNLGLLTDPARAEPQAIVWAVGVAAAIGGFGGALCMFGAAMARGRRWGAVGGLVATGLLAIAVLLPVAVVGPAVPCVLWGVLVPLGFTAYMCGVAVRDLKPLPRPRAGPRGFDVTPLPNPRPKVMPPPPTVRLARNPARPSTPPAEPTAGADGSSPS